MRALRSSLCVCALVVAACVPGLGPFRLPEVSGRVVDADSGAPLEGALVIEWHRGAGTSDASRPVYHARWATTAAGGRFHLPSGLSPSPRMWLLKTYAPVYAFYHPQYGLQWGARHEEANVVLRGQLARSEQALLDLRPYCRGEHDDAGALRLAQVACGRR